MDMVLLLLIHLMRQMQPYRWMEVLLTVETYALALHILTVTGTIEPQAKEYGLDFLLGQLPKEM